MLFVCFNSKWLFFPMFCLQFYVGLLPTHTHTWISTTLQCCCCRRRRLCRHSLHRVSQIITTTIFHSPLTKWERRINYLVRMCACVCDKSIDSLLSIRTNQRCGTKADQQNRVIYSFPFSLWQVFFTHFMCWKKTQRRNDCTFVNALIFCDSRSFARSLSHNIRSIFNFSGSFKCCCCSTWRMWFTENFISLDTCVCVKLILNLCSVDFFFLMQHEKSK